MNNLLMKLRDTVRKYADIVSQIADVDVEVVDDRLFRETAKRTALQEKGSPPGLSDFLCAVLPDL